MNNLPYSKVEIDERIENGSFTDKCTGKTFENMPPFRRIRFISSYGDKSYIRSELWLPDKWNGIFIGAGNGGVAGTFWLPPLAENIKNGYACAQTDMGTSKLVGHGEYHKDIFYDYGVRSTHIMTEVSKIIIENHYGKKPDFSYFMGSSAGGKQGFSEATNFPEDYNGIIAGVPSINGLFLVTWFLWRYILLYGKNGKVIFKKGDGVKLTDCVTEFFQNNGDGEKGDDFITYPYLGKDTLDKVLEYIHHKHPEFTNEQLDILKKVYEGPINPKTGEQIFPGLPFGAEIHSSGFDDCFDENGFGYPWFKCFFGDDFNELDFDFSDHFEKMFESVGKYMCTSKTDFSGFEKNGSKMIFYSGVADPAGPYADAMKHYNRICEKNGGYERVSKFIKFFLLPGKEHSVGGRGTNTVFAPDGKSDLLHAMRNWVEKGEEPEYIVAAHIRKEDKSEKFRRNIYPYKADKKEGIDFPKSTADRYLEMVDNFN